MKHVIYFILLCVFTEGNTQEKKTQKFDLINGITIKMIWVEPGSFVMGSPETDAERNSEREHQHRVTITRGFWLAETEFTQSQWEKITGKNPSKHIGPELPVEQVSFYDIQSLLNKINTPGQGFRLPTEAEWEYACRAGTTGPYYGEIENTTWHTGNSGKQSHRVAQKEPNQWGFFDLQGNILEWCADWFQADTRGESVDPKGPQTSTHKVQRGGQFTGRTKHTRASDRQISVPEARDFYVGFRLAKD